MTRRLAVRVALVVLPLGLLFLFARFAGPALDQWKRERIAGEGYTTERIPGRAAEFEITLPRARGRPEAERTAAVLDRFLSAVTGPRSPFGLERPDRPVKVLLFEGKADLENFAGVSFNKLLENNAGFYHPATGEIGLLRGSLHFDAVVRGLRHEVTHLLFDRASAHGLTPWLSEGLACYFEYAGPPREPDVEYLPLAASLAREGERLDLDGVLEAKQEVFLGADNDRYYAVAASTVAYLLDAAPPALRARFLEHVTVERGGGGRGAAGLERSLAIGVPELESRIAAWLGERGPG